MLYKYHTINTISLIWVSSDVSFLLQVGVQVQDLPTVLDADTTDTTFGLGATFSANQLWVASYDMSTTKPVRVSTTFW